MGISGRIKGERAWKTTTQPDSYLLGVSFFGWLAGWLGKLGVRVRDGYPGTKEGSLVGRQELVASKHGLVAYWGVKRVLGDSL